MLLCWQRSEYSKLWFFQYSCTHVWTWELDHKEDWALKNWCFWIVVLEKTLESPLDCKEAKPVNPKGNQSWIFIGRLLLRLKRQYFGPLCEEPTHWKRPWCWEDERQEKKHRGRGWGWNGYHHRLSGHEFEQTPEVEDRGAWHAIVRGVAKR